MTDSLEIHLAARPDGHPTLDAFRSVRVSVREPGLGDLLVRNLFMSLDPGMVMRMRAPELPLPTYRVGEVMHGDAIGEVVASRDPAFTPGDLVVHGLGWREYALVDAGGARRVDPAAYPSPSMHLGFGMVAQVGLDAAGLRAGDSVFISSAAGATGSLAGQIARLRGAGRVIGSAGSPEKVRYLIEVLGFDAAFDHHDGLIADRLREAAPDGIDVYFDNVGGAQLAAALEVLNPHGRVALCGAISQQRTGVAGASPLDPLVMIGKRLTLRGFTVLDHLDRAAEFAAEFRGWLREGSIVYDETVVDGLPAAPQALLDLLDGRHRGKVVVRI